MIQAATAPNLEQRKHGSMAARPWYLLIYVAIILGLVVVVAWIEQMTIDGLLFEDASTTAQKRAEYVWSQLDGELPSILAGNPPSAQAHDFLDDLQRDGSVFLYRIYDAGGTLRVTAAGSPSDENATATLAASNPLAARSVAKGQPFVEIKTGSPPDWPNYYAESYVPVMQNGKLQAVIAAYVDETDTRDQFNRALIMGAAQLAAVACLAFGIPAAAWYVRRRKQQRAEARAQYLADFDPVTAIANRQRLTKVVEAALTAQDGSAPIAVYCIDIDNFKDVNALYGIGIGDAVLKALAERLSALASRNDLVARNGGDEFAILRMNVADERIAEGFARRIVEEARAPMWIDDQSVRVTVSVGVALGPAHGRDATRLIKSADLALAKAKEEGPGGSYIFAPDLDVEFDQRLTLEQAILRTTETDGFVLHYQPLVDARQGAVAAFEALLRLPDAHGGLIPPSQFIPVAEKMDLIGRIGAWVLREACAAATGWPEVIRVCVNLSPAQFASGDLVGNVANALAASGLNPDRLELEITESLLLQDTNAVLRQLGQLKALGVHIVMDDFGTGHSSLSYLWQFSFDKIKIDASFLRASTDDDTAAAKIIRTVVALGHALNLKVNVEGVETEQQARFVRALGCDEMQGYLFSRPMPVSDIPHFLLSDFGRRIGGEITAPSAGKAA